MALSVTLQRHLHRSSPSGLLLIFLGGYFDQTSAVLDAGPRGRGGLVGEVPIHRFRRGQASRLARRGCPAGGSADSRENDRQRASSTCGAGGDRELSRRPSTTPSGGTGCRTAPLWQASDYCSGFDKCPFIEAFLSRWARRTGCSGKIRPEQLSLLRCHVRIGQGECCIEPLAAFTDGLIDETSLAHAAFLPLAVLRILCFFAGRCRCFWGTASASGSAALDSSAAMLRCCRLKLSVNLSMSATSR